TAVKGYPDLAGQTVGVTRGTVEDQTLTENATQSTIRRYEDVPTLVTAVVSGQVKLSAGSTTMLTNINKSAHNGFSKKFTMRESQIAVGLRKNNPELLAWVNAWIDTNLKNGKLGAIYKKYHGVELSNSIGAAH
ncbi:MAG TPA: transporter substrate-binding domain-containing protein, partial [Burkholderiaceae bacterium]